LIADREAAGVAGISIAPVRRKRVSACSSSSLRNAPARGIPIVFANAFSSVAYQ